VAVEGWLRADVKYSVLLEMGIKGKGCFYFQTLNRQEGGRVYENHGPPIDKDSDRDLPPDLRDHQKIRVSYIKDLLDNFEKAGPSAGSKVPRSTCVGIRKSLSQRSWLPFEEFHIDA
jgi:hypothetical protein